MNNSSIIGRISTDLVLRIKDNNRSVVAFNMVVKRRYSEEIRKVRIEHNEKVDDYIRCFAEGITAINLCTFMSKGCKIGFNGEIRNYLDDKKKSHTGLLVTSYIEYLHKPKGSEDK